MCHSTQDHPTSAQHHVHNRIILYILAKYLVRKQHLLPKQTLFYVSYLLYVIFLSPLSFPVSKVVYA